MIVTLTPNPALDITYAVPLVTLGESHRVASVSERAGGKGLNVAAVLAAMGLDVVAVAPVGRADIERFASDLSARRVSHRLVPSSRPTRRSVAVVEDGGRATLLNELGTGQSSRVWGQVLDEIAALAALAARAAPGEPGCRVSVLTISGSLAPGTDPHLVRDVTRMAQGAGLRVVLDVSGPALSHVLDLGPDLVKPNRVEAAQTLTVGGRGEVAPAFDAARALVAAGARAAVVSDGTDGLVLVHDDLALRAHLPRPVSGNPTGAGDALTASLAADVGAAGALPVGASSWAAVLGRGVAWAAAAVLQPVAGAVDPADVERLLPTVEIEEIPQ